MAKFILHFSAGHYTFSFHAPSGDKIASSPLFITKSSAHQGIHETRVASCVAHLYKKREVDGQYYFELHSETEKLLLVGEKHWSAESRDYGIMVIRQEGADAGFTKMIF